MPLSVVRLMFVWLLWACLGQLAGAQNLATDSLRRAVAAAPSDSGRVLLLLELARTYRASKPDTAMDLTQRAWQLAQKAGFDKGRGRAQGFLGMMLRERGELPKAFANQLAALQISRQTHDLAGQAFSLNHLGSISLDLRQYRQAIRYFRQSEALCTRLHLLHWVAGTLTNTGDCYERLNRLDSALALQQRALALIVQHPQPRLAAALVLRNMGTVQARLGHSPQAIDYYERALQETYANNDLRNRAMALYHLAKLYNTLHQPDSSLRHAREALQTARQVSYRSTVLEASSLLARLYQARHNVDSAFRYQALSMATQDSLFGPEKFQQLQLLAFTEQQRQLQQREAHKLQQAHYQQIALLAALGFILVIALLLLRINRQQQRANEVLNQRNAQIEAQRNELDRALTELQATQTQLVAAEKWAFVGELSAGIAHELQNPLAFMQNFAEVSVAMLEQERTGAAPTMGFEQKIMAGLKQNLREISQHGQRASSIITQMLAHARNGSSPPTPTDLNALITENLRLADRAQVVPHAPSAVELSTDLAADLGQVLVVPQEFGRAMLNLFTNAIHAVRRRQQLGETGYQPTVSVSTQRFADTVEIRVRDNGTGMSEAVAAQVFQPFFTTKAANEGTGLGLSLAHDIVEAHQGTLTVETKEGEFTEFTVRVPA